MHYSKVKREKKAECNLCRTQAELTWDHVPPQGGIELSSVEMRTVLQTLSGDPEKDKFNLSQNGVKFRTLCKGCNEWLGRKFDPTLNDFPRHLGELVRTPLHLPPTVDVETKPHRLIRGIVGHLVAAKAELDDVVFDRAVRDFIFDPSLPVPDDLHIFYWIYPYPTQVVLRDVAMPKKRGDFSEFQFCHVLKYFPIAFLVSDADAYEGLPELTRHRGAEPDDVVSLTIPLRDAPDHLWPEAPDKGNVLMGGQAMESSVFGSPRKK